MRDFHIHTTYCDGKDSPRDMVLSAIEKGVEEIGFSAHSYTFFDESYCIKKENVEKYKEEIKALREEFEDRIKLYCGIEQDYYSAETTEGFDYVIGSVHYVKKGDEYLPVDESEEIFCDIVKKYYNGDFYSLAEDYFETVSKVIEKTNADIIGHLDLITKFNEGGKLFDEKNERYVVSYKKAVDNLIKTGKVFEINTGAISRGYRSVPYPGEDIRDYIASKGGKFILSSDAHTREGLCFEFENYILS